MTKSTTQRWIYLFLLAVIAIITTTLYTGSFGQAENKDADETTVKADILKRVMSFAKNQDDPAPDLEISNPKPQMKKGDTLQLSLTDSNGSKVSGVSWYVITLYPANKIFTAEESQTAEDSHASVTADGLVK